MIVETKYSVCSTKPRPFQVREESIYILDAGTVGMVGSQEGGG